MRLSLNWLKNYVDPKLSTDDLAHRLTMAGFEVEGVHAVGADTVLELEITPNRPDCLSVWGMGREIAAMTGKSLHLPRIKAYKPTKDKISIAIEDKKDCGRYIATLMEGAAIAPSPAETARRLSAVGLRPLNNAVDVTNFVLMESGQPLHAFDYDKIAGGRIIVRRAKTGERIVTIDGMERKLDPSILVIADAQKPVAIAGVMGGKSTEVTSATKNILLESACFDAGLVRRASRALGLQSDSSYRFERGVDFEGVLLSANRAADLICSLTNARVTRRTDCFKTVAASRRPLVIGVSDIEGLLGTPIAPARIKMFLTSLGFTLRPSGKNIFRVTPPSWRGDIKAGVDIVEEVARMVGYDRLSEGLPVIKAVNIRVDPRPRAVRETLARALAAQGYLETVTYSLMGQNDLEKTGLSGTPVLALKNYLSQEYSILRPSLLPSMLAVAAMNFGHGQRSMRFFEMGKRYFEGAERWTLAILMAGKRDRDWRDDREYDVEVFDLGLEQVLRQAGITGVDWGKGTYGGLDPDITAHLKLNGHVIGALGRVLGSVLKNWDIGIPDVYFGEIDLEALLILPKPEVKYSPVSAFPAMRRDVSIAVRNDVPYARIRDLCLQRDGGILTGMHLIEQYTGEKIQSGYRGLVFSLAYQSNDRTLREEEVNAVHQNILDALVHDLGATLR
jgi:phenylalanyl-tRNA synthetase beta chain